MNTNKLRGKIVEMNLSVSQLANAMNIAPSTLYRKLEGGSGSFSVKEAAELTKILQLSSGEAVAIFFADVVADMRLDA